MKYTTSKYNEFIRLDRRKSVLVNLSTGNFLPMSDEDYNGVINGQINSEMYNALLEKHFIFENRLKEEEFIEQKIFECKNYECTRTILYGICISFECNLSCPYCYEKEIGLRRKLTEEELDQAFESILKIHNRFHSKNKIAIVLFGGEPFTKRNRNELEYFFRRVNYFIKEECSNTASLILFSNGLEILIYSKLLLQYKDIIDSVMLTLNGPKSLHDKLKPSGNKDSSFDKNINTIDFLLRHNFSTNVRMDIDRNSLKYIDEITLFVKEKRWNENKKFRYYISPIKWINSDDLLSESDIIEFFEYKKEDTKLNLEEVFSLGALRLLHNIINLVEKKSILHDLFYCEAVRGQQYVFGSDYKIYRCLSSIGKTSKSFGQFYPKLSLNENRVAEWRNRSFENIPLCRGCRFSFVCRGGCAYESELVNKDIYNPTCPDVKRILSVYFRCYLKGLNLSSYGFYYD